MTKEVVQGIIEGYFSEEFEKAQAACVPEDGEITLEGGLDIGEISRRIAESWPPAWRPIATAPRDGTAVLVCGGKLGVEFVSVAEWSLGEWRPCYCVSEDNFKVEPAHWMPCPEFPK